jgi:hypothetical protein
MRRITLLTVAVVLLSTGSVGADLMVQEHKPGEWVTLDTNTNYYWYWNLADFVNMDYGDQIDKIAGLGTYGNIAGGWHMATANDIMLLWAFNTAIDLEAGFGMTSKDLFEHDSYLGRIDASPQWAAGSHYLAQVIDNTKIPLFNFYCPDTQEAYYVGAWVCTDQPLVPLPPAVILAATGLLSSTLGLRRLGRKHQEPSQI